MRPEQEYVLNTIAAGEAPDYSTIYGGHKFKGFSSHPGIAVPIGNTGLSSTAAGRYQMLEKTWKDQAKKLGLKDFSPESQDLAAWDLAETTYQQKTGRSLAEDAKQHSVEWSALTNQWPSLMRFTGALAGMGAAALPQEYPSISPQILQQLPAGGKGPRLTPVDYDPFATSGAIP